MGHASLSDPPAPHPFGRRLLGTAPHRLDPRYPARRRRRSLEPQTAEEPILLASSLDERGTRQAQFHRTLLWPCLPVLPLATPTLVVVVGYRTASRLDLH